MKGIDVIKCLCYLGNTEGAGVTSTTPEEIEEMSGWLQDEFGVDEDSAISGTIEPNEDYLYIYEEELRSSHFTTNPLPNAIVTIDDTNIYLYKIE